MEQCAEIEQRGLTSVVIAGVYSPLDTTYNQEYKVREIIKRRLPHIRIVCSRDVGTIGFLERENASILNASILRFSEYVIQSFKFALKKLGLNCPLYLTQNDGTIIPAEQVKEIPIVTFSSGPTNSILGAAYLSQIKDSSSSILVADVGGTTTDIGILLPSGFPKQASAYLSIAGVRVNYAMPHVHTIGLGGGSIVARDSQDTSSVTVGPESVGLSLTKSAKVFGGDTLTATDIALLHNNTTFIEGGDISRLTSICKETTKTSFEQIQTNLTRAIDAIRTSPIEVPLILVGGGSMIIGDEIKGISKIIRPLYHEYANAVGAAVAKIASIVDSIVTLEPGGVSFEKMIELKKEEAIESVIKEKGAVRESTYIADVTSLPVQYSANKLRIIIKAAGEVDLTRASSLDSEASLTVDPSLEEHFHFQREQIEPSSHKNQMSTKRTISAVDYIPDIRNGVWTISQTDLHWLSMGCYVLGCAGGGSPQCEYLEVRNILNEGHEIKIQEYTTINDTDFVAWGGIMGSPAVSYERLGGTDTVDALAEILKFTGKEDCKALMCLEIGGANGLQSLIMASSKYFNKPLLDCDWMGRAYPTYYQTTLAAHTTGMLAPAAISDGVGNSLVLTTANSDVLTDVILRASCGEMGSRVGYAGRPSEGFLVKQYSVKNSYSLAWRIGRQIAYSQETNSTDQVVDRIINEVGGNGSAKKLFTGKITSVEQKLYKGHSYGQIVISSFSAEDQDAGVSSDVPFMETNGTLRIPYKNEIMYAEHEHDGTKKILASVPDLISVIDSQSGQAIGVPEFKFGLRVVVIGIAGSNLWTDSEKSKELGGPMAFG